MSSTRTVVHTGRVRAKRMVLPASSTPCLVLRFTQGKRSVLVVLGAMDALTLAAEIVNELPPTRKP